MKKYITLHAWYHLACSGLIPSWLWAPECIASCSSFEDNKSSRQLSLLFLFISTIGANTAYFLDSRFGRASFGLFALIGLTCLGMFLIRSCYCILWLGNVQHLHDMTGLDLIQFLVLLRSKKDFDVFLKCKLVRCLNSTGQYGECEGGYLLNGAFWKMYRAMRILKLGEKNHKSYGLWAEDANMYAVQLNYITVHLERVSGGIFQTPIITDRRLPEAVS